MAFSYKQKGTDDNLSICAYMQEVELQGRFYIFDFV